MHTVFKSVLPFFLLSGIRYLIFISIIQGQHTYKKWNKIFLIYKEIQNRAVVKSYMTDSSYMVKYLRISSYIRKPFLIYNFACAPFRISLYMRKIFFSFLSVYCGRENCWGLQEYNPGINRFYYQKQQFSLKFLSSRRISSNEILNFYLLIICYLPEQKYIP